MKRFKLLSFALLLPTLTAVAQTTVYSYTVPAPTATTGYAPNGNLLSYSDSLVNGSWSMTYDSLNRLTSASATSGPYSGLGLSMTYDSFGNRLTQTPTGAPPFGGTINGFAAHYDDGTNRVTSSTSGVTNASYDASGNLTSDGMNQLAYDPEGRICASENSTHGITLYLYDAEGRRVAKGHSAIQPATLTCSLGGLDFIPDETYVLGQSGEQVTEFDGSGNWQHTNVYAAGQLLATYDTHNTGSTVNTGLHFHIVDQLGTRRVEVSSTGYVELTCTNLPFGDSQYCSGPGADASEHHFTGKERDTESGLDYFGARYYASNMGRWMSPDWSASPSGVPYAELGNPQSLNLYQYVGNNPLGRADSDGHCWSVCGLIGWISSGVAADGGVKSFARNVISGLAKGVAQVGVGLAGGIAMQAGVPAGVISTSSTMQQAAVAATPSNLTQAQTAPVGSALAGAAVTAGVGAGVSALDGPAASMLSPQEISSALQGAPYETMQSDISAPMVNDYIDRLNAGEIAPPIRMDGNIIVDGNHRAAAGYIQGTPPATTPGTAVLPAKPLDQINVSPVDFRNPQ